MSAAGREGRTLLKMMDDRHVLVFAPQLLLDESSQKHHYSRYLVVRARMKRPDSKPILLARSYLNSSGRTP